MFCVHNTPEELIITAHFGFVFEENTSVKSRDYRDVITFEISFVFQNVFHPHENERPTFSNSSALTEERSRKAPVS